MTFTPTLVFDIETVPDITTGRRLYPELKTLSDEDALTALIAMRHAEAGNDFMRLPLHQIVCLSFLWVENGKFTLRSLSINEQSEADILSIFFRAFTRKPTVVSWNGLGFDIPVLQYRALHHKISAPALFDPAHKPDYLYRYGNAHIDLMDKMSLYNGYHKQNLDTIAALCGFAGKGDIDGSQVVPMVQSNQWGQLTTYCESDVLNTWLVYLRWLLLTGKTSIEECDALSKQTQDFVSNLINKDGRLRHARFLEAWQG
ncbi:3'-5' exonuclease [Moraxella sp. Tifton1]|uniref:3'-5' exonuclease n=1 Tax=Moraxella oculi TaxID=2940516 RepID=A0ABW8U8L8_9GAMM|nr:3'-5' exonuclease [Moraxella sp. Tifton1]MCL1623492.1 3'-5' exonuclease [Moraxella sp. Tifton1]